MALQKYKTNSPNDLLAKAPYNESALARIAHVNDLVEKLNTKATSLPAEIGATPNLTGSTVSVLKDQTEVRLDVIEAKIDALIAALKA